LNQDKFGPLFPTLPGSTTKPNPGWNVDLLTAEGEKVPRGGLGNLVAKLPLPPSAMSTLWGSDEKFIEKYLTEFPGYYSFGDEGVVDERGFLSIMSRTDDVINVAGHRLDTGRLEEAINKHSWVVESAVVGFNDYQKG